MRVSVTRWTMLSGLILSVSFACGRTEVNQSELMIRGGQDVKDSDISSLRKSTIALTTDYVGSKVGTPSILDLGQSFCSGTIVAPRVVVTAAHCVQQLINNSTKGGSLLPKPADFVVHFDAKVSGSGIYLRAEKVIPHPDWSPAGTLSPFPTSKPNDIGVVILAEEIPDSMRPATIASTSIKVNGGDAYLAGYGVTKDRNTNDTGTLRALTTKFSAENGTIARVSHGAWFKGICAGDSGGPAYVNVGGDLQLVGAASTGAEIPLLGCAGTGGNSTDVRYYKDWIKSVSPN